MTHLYSWVDIKEPNYKVKNTPCNVGVKCVWHYHYRLLSSLYNTGLWKWIL